MVPAVEYYACKIYLVKFHLFVFYLRILLEVCIMYRTSSKKWVGKDVQGRSRELI